MWPQIVLRHLAGMEMHKYIDEKLAQPMDSAPGDTRYIATEILLRTRRVGEASPSGPPTRCACRTCCCIRGKWGNQQLVPADYVAMCGRPSPYNPHFANGSDVRTKMRTVTSSARRATRFFSRAQADRQSTSFHRSTWCCIRWRAATRNSTRIHWIALAYEMDHSATTGNRCRTINFTMGRWRRRQRAAASGDGRSRRWFDRAATRLPSGQ